MEEFEEELQKSTQTEIITETDQETKTDLGSSFDFEEMIKSEKQSKEEIKTDNLVEAEQTELVADRVFARPNEKRKILAKRRLKLVTAIYTGVLVLLLTFTGVNLATLIGGSKDITNNTQTIEKQEVALEYERKNAQEIANSNDEIMITMNLPKDYSEDEKELTFLDKITIMFKHLFS